MLFASRSDIITSTIGLLPERASPNSNCFGAFSSIFLVLSRYSFKSGLRLAKPNWLFLKTSSICLSSTLTPCLKEATASSIEVKASVINSGHSSLSDGLPLGFLGASSPLLSFANLSS